MDSTYTNGSFPHPEPSPSSSSESSSQAAAAGTLSLNSPSADGSTKSRKRSLAWVHYGKLDDKTAVCDLCGDKIDIWQYYKFDDGEYQHNSKI